MKLKIYWTSSRKPSDL